MGNSQKGDKPTFATTTAAHFVIPDLLQEFLRLLLNLFIELVQMIFNQTGHAVEIHFVSFLACLQLLPVLREICELMCVQTSI